MNQRKISVIGLGYVGLPVAVAFAKHQKVIGFDINSERIGELLQGYDRTDSTSPADLELTNLTITDSSLRLSEADFHIIAVPTPVSSARQPDFSALIGASQTAGSILKKGDIVVYESTVYPGATEEICIPELEKTSGLVSGKDFFVGYSPERINPGDKINTFETIVKVVGGQTPETTGVMRDVYETVVRAGVHEVTSIKVAEAAKVIENTQRDLNIALMNELALIFSRIGIDTNEVLTAAGTKWNFLKFKPGLVGGHCIGIDPYYLTYKAKQLDYRPELILAGRRINDRMGKHIAQEIIKSLIMNDAKVKGANIGILGLTFKENCNDLRNSKVTNVINELVSYGCNVLVHDPLASAVEAKRFFDIQLVNWEDLHTLDGLVLAVAHQEYVRLDVKELKKRMLYPHLLFDIKGIFDKEACIANGLKLWRL